MSKLLEKVLIGWIIIVGFAVIIGGTSWMLHSLTDFMKGNEIVGVTILGIVAGTCIAWVVGDLLAQE